MLPCSSLRAGLELFLILSILSILSDIFHVSVAIASCETVLAAAACDLTTNPLAISHRRL